MISMSAVQSKTTSVAPDVYINSYMAWVTRCIRVLAFMGVL